MWWSDAGYVAYVTNAMPIALIPMGSLLGPDRVVLPDVGDDGTVRTVRVAGTHSLLNGTLAEGLESGGESLGMPFPSTAMASGGM